MCCRLKINNDAIEQWLRDAQRIEFHTQDNLDLRPSQVVDVIDSDLGQLKSRWGIKPAWAKHLILNAQSETVDRKKTFHQAFQARRCLVPCMGWYEWRDEGLPRKTRYLFSDAQQVPFLMAGIWFDSADGPLIVTLTSPADPICRAIHHRMPTLITADALQVWLMGTPDEAISLLHSPALHSIAIEKVDHLVA